MQAPDLARASLGRVYRAGAADRACLLILCLAAALFAIGVLWARAQRRLGFPSHDIYALFYPTTQYALRSLREWSGLLWNPYQDCGQPFFAFGQVGLLYPVNFVFLLLPRETALVANVILNLSIGGAGMFLLCRQLNLHRTAALAGAFAFQFGGTALQLASWSPIHIGTYVWLPVAMWGAERVIARPTARAATLLGLVLAVQLLPGFVQTSFFTYQLIALRTVWAVVFGETERRLAVLAAVAFALLLAPLMVGLQLLPSLEVARQSLRQWQLPETELGAGFSWPLARRAIEDFAHWQSAVVVAVAALPLLLYGSRRQRADVAFYVFAAGLHFLLSLGPGMPLFDLYARLPLATAFRGAGRLIWVSNFAVTVLAAFAVEAIVRLDRGRAALIASIVAGTLALHWLTRDGLSPTCWALAALLVAASAVARRERARTMLGAALPLLVLAQGLFFAPPPLFDLRTGDVYGGSEGALRIVRERLTAQDRMLIVSSGLDPYAFTPKTASLNRMPNIFDYETQASQSYAEFFTYMRTGRPLRALNDWYWVFGSIILPTLQRPLFDLTAARYLIVNPTMTKAVGAFAPPLRLVHESPEGSVYENPQALPRARYVPRAVIMAADAILPALANESVDARAVALLSEPPRSGFLGSAPPGATGTAEIVVDRAERVVVRVHASAPGFLFLADQFFPGWQVYVDGKEGEMLRADHTFRLVEVPAGDSTVEFRYRPRSIVVGALLSLVGVGLCILLGLRRTRVEGRQLR